MTDEAKDGSVGSREPRIALARKLTVVAWILTIVVWGLVGAMRQFKVELPAGIELTFLPLVHAILNSLVAVFLLAALGAIRRKNVGLHQRMVSMAMLCSIVFLACYVAYHITTEETKFGGTGTVRIVYFVLLISHIVLAAISLPFILQTWIYGYTGQVVKHRRLAKWVFPVWLFVAISGPICYLMLRPYY